MAPTGSIKPALGAFGNRGRSRRLWHRAAWAAIGVHPAVATATPVEQANSPLPPIDCSPLERSQVVEVCSLLSRPDVRLLTLTGAPGAGKSRLASAVAAALDTQLAHGVVRVDLARVRQESGVAQAVAEALRGRTNRLALVDELVAWLWSKHMLLVLDHAEHLQDQCQSLVRLLEGCPQLRLLLTSRAGLPLDGEVRFVVRSDTGPLERTSAAFAAAPARPRTALPPDARQTAVRHRAGWSLRPGPAADDRILAPLTTREQQVARLLALGYSNQQIADELVITYRTAETHACRVLRKLSLTSRHRVVAWAIEHGLVVVAPPTESIIRPVRVSHVRSRAVGGAPS